MVQKQVFQFKGMNRDINPMSASSDYAYEIRNMRITVNKTDNSLFVLTNEKGPASVTRKNKEGITKEVIIEGTYLGHAVLRNYLIVFSKWNQKNYIIRYTIGEDGNVSEKHYLLTKNINFNESNPIETLSCYENDKVQKVYFVDGINQPRVVNITKDLNYYDDNPHLLDFVPTINLSHQLNIEKLNTGGTFPTGTIQYCFSYFNKYGQETKIFETSPLYYLSDKEKGALTNEIQTCAFNITLSNVDRSYEYVRCYSLIRTSQYAVPVAKIVGDYKINGNSVYIRDTNNEGSTIDARQLLFVGGKEFTASTLTQKDGTLFLGDIKVKNTNIDLTWKDYNAHMCLIDEDGELAYDVNWKEVDNKWKIEAKKVGRPYKPYITILSEYAFINNNKSSRAVKRFKTGEYYLFGIIGQFDNGDYTQVFPLDKILRIGGALEDKAKTDKGEIITDEDRDANLLYPLFSRPNATSFYFKNNNRKKDDTYQDCYLTHSYKIEVKKEFLQQCRNNNIVKLYPVVVYPTPDYRSCITQGFVSPTVFKSGNRKENSPYAQPSWFYRFYNNQHNDESKIIVGDVEININFMDNPNKTDHLEDVLGKGYYKATDILLNDNKSALEIIPNARHYASLWSNYSRHAEVQWHSGYDAYGYYKKADDTSNIYNPYVKHRRANMFNDSNAQYIGGKYQHDKIYLYDCNILTLNSPETELGLLKKEDLINTKFRFIGFSSFIKEGLNYNCYKFYTVLEDVDNNKKINRIGVKNLNDINKDSFTYVELDIKDNTGLMAGQVELVNKSSKYSSLAGFLVEQDSTTACYPFMSKNIGSIQEHFKTTDGIKQYLKATDIEIKRKILSQRYQGNTRYEWVKPTTYKTDSIEYYNFDQITAVKIKCEDYSGDALYYGNVDDIINVSYIDGNGSTTNPIFPASNSVAKDDILWYENVYTNDSKNNLDAYTHYRLGLALGSHKDDKGLTTSMRVKYRSTPHIIFSLSKILDTTSTVEKYNIPVLSREVDNVSEEEGRPPYWNKEYVPLKDRKVGEYRSIINESLIYDILKYENKTGFSMWASGLFIGEFYRKPSDIGIVRDENGYMSVKESSYMGGITNQPFLNWVICGNAVTITDDMLLKKNAKTCYLIPTEGDHYVGRYDSLKTYPFDESTGCGIVEIFSSQLETRVNIHARVDRNRDLVDNTAVRPYSNFNIYNNQAYEQDNNFFTFKTKDNDNIYLDNFDNQITWSLEKILGEHVDTWTSIPLTSTLDLDGDKGNLKYLTTFNNDIYAFQEHGLSKILFNSRVQIPTSDNNPIEITNGYKVDGKYYLSSKIGTTNKWSVVSGNVGVYFIDTLTDKLYVVSGDTITDLSQTLGMTSYFNGIHSTDSWNPSTSWEYISLPMKGFFDKDLQEVYFSNGKETLVYSEMIQSFTSFFDYSNIQILENINGKLVASSHNYLVKMFEGYYNTYISKDGGLHLRNYYIEFYTNQNNTNYNKFFNNLEWQTEVFSFYDIDEETPSPSTNTDVKQFTYSVPNLTWKYLEANTPYASSRNDLEFTINRRMGNLEKLFNVWRTYIPGVKNSRGVYNKLAYQYAKIRLSSNLPLSLDLYNYASNHKFRFYNTTVMTQPF